MAPALANIKAIPLPIPRDAPVTMHTFPDNEGSSDVMVQLGDLLDNNGKLLLNTVYPEYNRIKLPLLRLIIITSRRIKGLQQLAVKPTQDVWLPHLRKFKLIINTLFFHLILPPTEVILPPFPLPLLEDAV